MTFTLSPEVGLVLVIVADLLWVLLALAITRWRKNSRRDWQPTVVRLVGLLVAAVLVQTTLRALVPYGLPVEVAETGSTVLRGLFVLVGIAALWSVVTDREEDDDEPVP